ncbi:MAG: endonuclease/exonuclease/phosphatase family protein, partial [Candidatus Cloacimonetes bacterium]|nr:endonuclease/exonuclease/phosphatase family protein [Candidatus Cloacimonadota bacterium]
MRFRNYWIALICLVLLIAACGKNTELTPPDIDHTDISFGTDNTLDIITWNLKLFPEATNISELKQMIPALNADVIAFQEIMDYTAFMSMVAQIPNYAALVYDATAEYRLAYVYDTRTITVNNQYTIYNGESNPFPRPPYVLDFNWNNENYYVINNHLKAYGDNYIDESDDWDDEYRRRTACQKLDYYISTSLPDKKVIVVGDMNDQIAEPAEYNVFLSFLDKPTEYLFA